MAVSLFDPQRLCSGCPRLWARSDQHAVLVQTARRGLCSIELASDSYADPPPEPSSLPGGSWLLAPFTSLLCSLLAEIITVLPSISTEMSFLSIPGTSAFNTYCRPFRSRRCPSGAPGPRRRAGSASRKAPETRPRGVRRKTGCIASSAAWLSPCRVNGGRPPAFDAMLLPRAAPILTFVNPKTGTKIPARNAAPEKTGGKLTGVNSAADRSAMMSMCPAFISPQTPASPTRRRYENVLVPVDGSANSLRAVRYMVDYIQENGPCALHLLNVQLPIVSGTVLTFIDQKTIQEYYEDEAKMALSDAKALLDRAGIVYEGRSARRQYRRHDQELRHRTKRCDHIVMGSRGLGAAGSLLLGSVTGKCCTPSISRRPDQQPGILRSPRHVPTHTRPLTAAKPRTSVDRSHTPGAADARQAAADPRHRRAFFRLHGGRLAAIARASCWTWKLRKNGADILKKALATVRAQGIEADTALTKI